jgi:hypothetical protein
MIEFTWKITKFEVIDEGSLSDVAIISYFELWGNDGDLQGMVGSDVRLLPPDPGNFVPLDDITADEATAWTIAALGDKTQMFEEMVTTQIESQKVQQPRAVELPWMNG